MTVLCDWHMTSKKCKAEKQEHRQLKRQDEAKNIFAIDGGKKRWKWQQAILKCCNST